MKNFFLLLFFSTQLIFAQEPPVIGAYYENWSQYRPTTHGRPTFFPSLIDPTIITDLYFAFGIFGFVTRSVDPQNPHLTGDFTVQPVEWNDQSTLYPQVMALKQINPKLRVLLSIGGWSFNDPNDPNGIGTFTYQLFSKMVATSESRAEFIHSAVAYAQRYGFDGIDIDWEYPGDLTRGGSEADLDNFVLFLKECQEAFQGLSSPLLLTYASPAIVPTGLPQKYHDQPELFFQWLANCAPYLDRFNVMAYDYHGAFDVPKLTGVNAPLQHDTLDTSSLYIANSIKNYLQYGVPADKIVLGMPTYGHSYGGVSSLSTTNNGPGLPFIGGGAPGPSTGQAGVLAYYEVMDMLAQNTLTSEVDAKTNTVYGYNISTQTWVSFDDPDTIRAKVNFAQSQGLLGWMFWAIDMDEYHIPPTYPNIRSTPGVSTN